MKKLLSICLISLAFACNSGTTTTDTNDTTSMKDPDAGIKSDVPMRTTDTTTNLMNDTLHMSDTSKTH